ncbi:Transcription-silencing protein Clr2 [Penicillium sp. DV-2018c]|nr:Transcription-silencing protein Clr2 [Penicillium sp. DV-2018c]
MEEGSTPNAAGPADVPPPANNDRQPEDADGQDYWRMMIMKLKDKGELDEAVEQPLDPTGAFNHELLSDYFKKLAQIPAYVPRRGELVIFTLEGLKNGWLMSNDNGHFELFGYDNKWHGAPYWRAGVVIGTPDEDTQELDIIEKPVNSRGLGYPGFSLEILPDPLSGQLFSMFIDDIPLRDIRPFNAWQIFLQGQDRHQQDPSIEDAMAVMSSHSTVHQYHIVGKGEDCRVHCKGIFVGAELLAVSDTIRLEPESTQCYNLRTFKPAMITDVMVIEQISLPMKGIVDHDIVQLVKDCVPLISGRVYTLDPKRVATSRLFPDPTADNSPTPLTANEAKAVFRQDEISDYGPWYRMAQGRICEVTPSAVVGRCYEPLAAEMMFETSDLNYDLRGVWEGRRFSEQVYSDMPAGKTWLWGDSRVEKLVLPESDIETAPQYEDPKKWGAVIGMERVESSHKSSYELQCEAEISEASSSASSSSDESSDESGGDDDKDLSELFGDALTESDSMDELA